MSRFSTILADPPWSFKLWSEKGAKLSASVHYKTQDASWICSLPVHEVAAADCTCFMWATYPNLPEAIQAMAGWGFQYKTVAFTWVKTINGREDKTRMGLGYWSRSNAEICLLGTRGQPKRLNKDVEQIIACPIARHSQKPDEQYTRIERLVGGPYLEMFARPRGPLFPYRDGWTQIGNEVTGRDIREDLCLLAAQPDVAFTPYVAPPATPTRQPDLFGDEGEAGE